MGQCAFIKTDGDQCKAPARSGRSWCFWHDPELEGKRKQARRRGGRTTAQKNGRGTGLRDLPELPLQNVEDCLRLLADTILKVRGGHLDVRVGNCLGYLCNVYGRLMETSELEQRIEEIEERLEQERQTNEQTAQKAS